MNHWPDRRRGQLFAALAGIGWSTAGIFQRQLSVGTVTQVAGRAIAAALFLSIVLVVRKRSQSVAVVRGIGRWGLLFAWCMAGAMGLFIDALNNAPVASVLFIQALAPFVAVVLAFVMIGENSSLRTWIVTSVAIGGAAVMLGPERISSRGIASSLAMTVLFALTIVIARRQRHISMFPALLVGQLSLIAVTAPFADFASVTANDATYFAILGVVQMGFSQICFAAGARLLPAAEVALWTLLEVVLGPVWVWCFVGEQPGQWTLLGGTIVIGAVVVQAFEAPGDDLRRQVSVDASANV